MPIADRGGLWRRWVATVTAGELVGFAAPASSAALLAALPDVPLVALFLVLPAAGAFEGAVLGLAQVRVLGDVVPGLLRRRWVAATSMAAVVAWLLGLSPSVTSGWWSSWPVPAQVAAVGIVGVAVLLSIGTAQAVVLRHHRPVVAWVSLTALAWLVGLGAFFLVTTPLWHPGQSPAGVVAVGLLAAVAMAAAMAATTGLAVLRLATTEATRR
jgi:hypothetical protein